MKRIKIASQHLSSDRKMGCNAVSSSSPISENPKDLILNNEMTKIRSKLGGLLPLK
jgi:hypothetical protein